MKAKLPFILNQPLFLLIAGIAVMEPLLAQAQSDLWTSWEMVKLGDLGFNARLTSQPAFFNDKGQAVVFSGSADGFVIILPEPDYGLQAGVHSLGNLYPTAFNNNGTVFGKLYDPDRFDHLRSLAVWSGGSIFGNRDYFGDDSLDTESGLYRDSNSLGNVVNIYGNVFDPGYRELLPDGSSPFAINDLARIFGFLVHRDGDGAVTEVEAGFWDPTFASIDLPPGFAEDAWMTGIHSNDLDNFGVLSGRTIFLNAKGEVVIRQSGNSYGIWLPFPAYGLPAGFNDLKRGFKDQLLPAGALDFNDKGEIAAGGWVYQPNQQAEMLFFYAHDPGWIAVRAVAINNNSEVLGIAAKGGFESDAYQAYILRRATRCGGSVSTNKVTVGGRFTYSLSITNISDFVINQFSPLPPIDNTRGDLFPVPEIELVDVTPAGPVSLERNESVTFTWTVEAKAATTGVVNGVPGKQFYFRAKGINAAGSTVYSHVGTAVLEIVEGQALDIEVGTPEGGFETGDNFIADLIVRLKGEGPRTFILPDPLLWEEPPDVPDLEDSSILTVGYIDVPEPFELTSDDPVRVFEVPVSVRKSGVTELASSVQVADESGEVEEIEARKKVSVSPFEITITTTPKQMVLNQTPQDQKSMGCPPGAENCVEIKATIRNKSNRRIDNVNVPAATQVLSMITSRDLEDPTVPLTPLLFVPPAGTPEAPEFVTLEPAGSTTGNGTPTDTTTFVWYLDAYDAPADLDIKVLALGSIDGVNVQGLGQGRLKLIKDVLLEWGIRPRGGRTSYLAGQPAGVDAFIENVSKENGEGKDLVVLVYQLPEGNLGGGFMQKASEAGQSTPEYYKVFELPPEGDARRLDLSAIFDSLPLDEPTEGRVRYDVRVWVKNEDGGLTSADSQAKLAVDWSDEFKVQFAAVVPPPDSYRDECLEAGIPAEICGISEGFYFVAAEDAFGLTQFAAKGWSETKVLAPQVVSYNVWMMYLAWQALKNDQEATRILLQESYAQYTEFVNLGVMAGEAGSHIPMVFDAFVDQGVETFDSFIHDLATGDLTNIRANVGKFLGSNPDMLLEPLIVGITYSRMSRSLASAADNLADDVIKAHLRYERERRAISRDQRLAAAETDPNVTNLATVLKPGDELPDHLLRRIYGLGTKQREALQKFCQENHVIVAFRSRHPKSVALLEAEAAYPKPKALKWKNVNDIDVKFLGYRQDALATVQIVEPPPGLIGKSGDDLEAALDAYMTELRSAKPEFDAEFASNPVLAGEVRGRLRTQAKMWNKHAAELDLKDIPSRTEIGVNFGTNAQFTHDVAEDVGVNELRNVHLNPVEGAPDPVTGNPRRTWELKMDGPKGAEPKAVTGDIDFLAILDENGMFIEDDDKRIQLYKQLAEMVEMQHGESFAFRLQEMRADFLRCCVEGKEAMVTIGPWAESKPTAGYFVDNLSVMDSGPNSRFRRPRQKTGVSGDPDVVLHEGELLEARHADPSGEFPLINGMPQLLNINYAFVNRFRPLLYEQLIEGFKSRLRFYFPAIMARLLFRDAGNEDTTVEPEFSADGPVLRAVPVDPEKPNGARLYQVWTEEGGWRDIGVDEAIELSGGNLNQIQGNASTDAIKAESGGGPVTRIQLAPMTTITEGARAGDYTIRITELAELGVGGTFFESGVRIVINPGGENEEFARVVAMGPLMVANALSFDHESGEIIALANREPALPRLTVSSVGGGAILLSWESGDGSPRLETTDNLSAPIEWIGVTETPVIDGAQATLELEAADYARFFRLVSQ